MNTKDLDEILKPIGYSYVFVTQLIQGDKVRWFNQDAVVTSVDIRSDACYIKVIGCLDGQEKEFRYKKTDELIKAPRSRLN